MCGGGVREIEEMRQKHMKSRYLLKNFGSANKSSRNRGENEAVKEAMQENFPELKDRGA